MEYDFKKIGERIRQRRKEKGIRSCENFIEKLAECGYPVGRNRLLNIENGKADADISLSLILAMAAVLDCEAGYLLCEYDLPTRKDSDVHAETGLSEDAIHVLRVLKFYDESQSENMKVLPWLDLILSNPCALVPFLNAVRNYKTADFRIPVYSDQDGKRVTSTNKTEDGMYLQELAKDEKNLSDTVQFAYSEDFLKAVAMHQIEIALSLMLDKN